MRTQPGAGEAFDSAVKGGDAHPQDLFFPLPVLRSLCQFIWAGAEEGHWLCPAAAERQDSPGLSQGDGTWANRVQPNIPWSHKHQESLE